MKYGASTVNLPLNQSINWSPCFDGAYFFWRPKISWSKCVNHFLGLATQKKNLFPIDSPFLVVWVGKCLKPPTFYTLIRLVIVMSVVSHVVRWFSQTSIVSHHLLGWFCGAVPPPFAPRTKLCPQAVSAFHLGRGSVSTQITCVLKRDMAVAVAELWLIR